MDLMGKKLSDKENFILKGRFGIERDDSMTLEEVANELGVSYEHVRIIQNKAIEKLRKTL
jgi:RNA polymerase sigma factor (sigma-70 family)